MITKGPFPKDGKPRTQWRLGQILNGCIPSRPPPESLPRTPELLAQGPVSLLTSEKHTRAL
uniref:Macaca fascicularis brain cDNA, clone: QflA-16828 n=1 Tax=Macaca fascicularis TaxID=9541 RepID=I7GME3_MACFA|nr:unnamed protein product [Macaca fascicularis]